MNITIDAKVLDILERGAWDALPRVRGQIARLFTASCAGYDYSHHASLTAAGGQLVASWSNGHNGEDLPGQVQSWCRRAPEGRWGTPQILARSPMLAAAATTAINGGSAEGTERLTVFFSEYKGRVQDGTGGTGKWSLPVVTGALVNDPVTGAWLWTELCLYDLLLNEGPRCTSSGRWVMTGEDHAGRTQVIYSDSPVLTANSSWHQVALECGAGSVFKNEPSWYECANGTLVLWMRDDGGSQRLWVAFSADMGATWSVPVPSAVPDAVSKCRAGTLSTGTRYLILNPNLSTERIPLVMLLSQDGWHLDRALLLRDEATAPHLPGRYKGSGYQYPCSLELDGQLHLIYSVNKEEVEVQSLALSDIG